MSMFSLMIDLFAVIFWIIRVAVAFTASMDIEFFLAPMNLTIEIILTFATLISIILIFRKNMLGALMYLVLHWGYYGVYIYNIFQKAEEVATSDYLNLFASIIGVILPFIIFMDIGFSRSSNKTSMKTKQSDWFYQNKDYDRKYDERADKNQYRTL